MALYTFTCKAGHTSDKIVSIGTEKVTCPTCGKVAKRLGVEAPAWRNPSYGIQK